MNIQLPLRGRSIITLSALLILKNSAAQPTLFINQNCNKQLEFLGLVKKNNPVRLHLGCGEQRLPGYINIDFSPASHTAQKNSGADCFADITTLSFSLGSIDEVRLHHVFEHFDRIMALALLCTWHRWLKQGGSLILETPDMHKCAQLLANPTLSYKDKEVVARHLFGSHEASWALHKDGWYKEKFETVLQLLGFQIVQSVNLNTNSLVPNIAIQAVKVNNFDTETLIHKAQAILRYSLVDNSASEESIWIAWREILEQNLKKLGFYSSLVL
jgi:predicted SAM-dependent methyltransferase